MRGAEEPGGWGSDGDGVAWDWDCEFGAALGVGGVCFVVGDGGGWGVYVAAGGFADDDDAVRGIVGLREVKMYNLSILCKMYIFEVA